MFYEIFRPLFKIGQIVILDPKDVFYFFYAQQNFNFCSQLDQNAYQKILRNNNNNKTANVERNGGHEWVKQN